MATRLVNGRVVAKNRLYMGDSMADNYTYRDISSGEAFREHLGSLGWSKPRKNQPVFTQEYGEDLIFRAAFLYATFNHTPGNYSGIPAFYVMSKKWRKTLRKISAHLDQPLKSVPSPHDGDLYFISVGHPRYHEFVDHEARMTYLRPDGTLNIEAFTRFSTAAHRFMETFDLADYVALTEQELQQQRLDTVLPDVLGYLSVNTMNDLRDELYRNVHAHLTDRGATLFADQHVLRRRWDVIADYFSLT